MKSTINILLCLFICSALAAQIDTVRLPEIRVVGPKSVNSGERFGMGEWRKVDLSEGINSPFFGGTEGLFIRQYGPGQLATLTYNGASASQTLIMWEGLPITNPMVGLADMSLVDIGLFDRCGIGRGNSQSAWGNGAIAGAMDLGSDPVVDGEDSMFWNLEAGSFGSRYLQGKVSLKGRKHFYEAKVTYGVADNDFRFNLEDGSTKYLANAMNRRLSTLHSFGWLINNKHTLVARVWAHDGQRQIPPLTTQQVSEASQEDQFFRNQLTWNAQMNNILLRTTVAYFSEENNYNDRVIGLNSSNSFQRGLLKTEIRKEWLKMALVGGMTYDFIDSNSKAYDQSRQVSTWSSFVRYRHLIDRLEIVCSLQGSYFRSQWNPILPTMRISYNFRPGLAFGMGLGRVFRQPAINDLYWNPGGNPLLKPERGWEQEVWFDFAGPDHKFEFEFSAYNRNITNWIRWAVVDGSPFFSAYNIAEVWSRGGQVKTKYSNDLGKVRLRLSSSYHLNKSTHQVSISLPEISKGDQIVYTPVHQAMTGIGIQYGNFDLEYSHRFVGKSAGINEDLEAYDIGLLRAGLKSSEGHNRFEYYIVFQNIWNEDYRIIERRPLPGRSLQIGIKIEIGNL